MNIANICRFSKKKSESMFLLDGGDLRNGWENAGEKKKKKRRYALFEVGRRIHQ
jgi:hypothetical protein